MTLTIHLDKFSILGDLLKPGSTAISDLNFSSWINSRHAVLRMRKPLFPTLVFLMRKYFSRGILTIIKDTAEKDEVPSLCNNPDFCLTEHKSHSEFTVQPTFSETLIKIAPQFPDPLRIDPDKTRISDKVVTWIVGCMPLSEERVGTTHSKTGSAPLDNGIRSELGAEEHRSPWQFPLITVSQFTKLSHARLFMNESWQGKSTTDSEVHRELPSNSRFPLRSLWFSETRFRNVSKSRPPHTGYDKARMPDKGVSRAVGREFRAESEEHKSLWQSPFTAISQFKRRPHINQDDKNRISGENMPRISEHKHIPKEGLTQHPVSDSRAPIMYYHSHTDVALDGLKESVADIEKKLAERGDFIGKSGSDNAIISDRMSDTTDNMNSNLVHLTDQVYKMLERKIMIEKERRGW